MFPLTRVSAKIANTGRNLVKKVATNKINLQEASADVVTFHKTMNDIAPHSKSILKRTYNWLKTFFITLKNSIQELKKQFAEEAELLGEKLSFKEKLAIVKNGVSYLTAKLDQIKEEMTKLSLNK